MYELCMVKLGEQLATSEKPTRTQIRILKRKKQKAFEERYRPISEQLRSLRQRKAEALRRRDELRRQAESIKATDQYSKDQRRALYRESNVYNDESQAYDDLIKKVSQEEGTLKEDDIKQYVQERGMRTRKLEELEEKKMRLREKAREREEELIEARQEFRKVTGRSPSKKGSVAKLTVKEAQMLSPETRKVFGVEVVTKTETRMVEQPAPEPDLPKGTPEEILAEWEESEKKPEQRAWEKFVNFLGGRYKVLRERTDPLIDLWLGKKAVDYTAKKYKESEKAQKYVKQGGSIAYTYTGTKSAVGLVKGQWKWLGESEFGKKKIDIPIAQINLKTGDVSYTKIGDLDRQYKIMLKRTQAKREERVRPQFEERSQRLFESIYLKDIYEGKLKGEEAIKLYQESPEYKELQRQYSISVARESTWKEGGRVLYAEVGKAITPSTYGGAIKGAEVVTGGVVGLKLALPTLAKIQASQLGSWGIIGAETGIATHSGVKIRDVTLPKEERIKAVAFTTVAGGSAYYGLAQKIPVLKTPFQYGKIALNKLSFGKLYKGYDPSLSYKYRIIESTTRSEIPRVPYKAVKYGKLRYSPISSKGYLKYTTGQRMGRALGTGSKLNLGRTTFYYKTPIRVSVPDISKVGRFRRTYGLWDLYATPSGEWVKVSVKRSLWQRLTVGKPLKRLLTGKPLLAKATVVKRIKPFEVYGGYIGIGGGRSAQTVIGFGDNRYLETIRYLGRAKVPTAWRSTDVKRLAEQLRYYGQSSRSFTLSAETLKGASVEKQVNVSLGQVLQKAPKSYYQPLQSKWFYYKQVPQASTFAQQVLGSKYFTTEVLGGVEKTVYKSKVVEAIRRTIFTDRILVRSRELQPILYETAVSRGLMKKGVPYQDLIPKEPTLTGIAGAKVSKTGEVTTTIIRKIKSTPINVTTIKDNLLMKAGSRAVSSAGLRYVSGSYLLSQPLTYSFPFLYSSPAYSGFSLPSISKGSSGSRLSDDIPQGYSSPQSRSSSRGFYSFPSYPSIPSEPSIPSTPSIPSIPKTPSTPSSPIVSFYLSGRRGRKKKLKDVLYSKAYSPDFTSRIVGLEPVKLTKTNAEKLVKKAMTGLEIRRGVKLI